MNDPQLVGGLIALLVVVAMYVWIGLSLAALFTKAAEEGWKAWVPVYNLFTLFELGGLSGWLVLLGFVPIVGQIAYLVFAIIAYHRVNAAFGNGAGMTVLAVLLFPVWTSVLGWGPARWIGRDEPGAQRPPGPARQGLPDLDERIAGVSAAPGREPAAPLASSVGSAAAAPSSPPPPASSAGWAPLPPPLPDRPAEAAAAAAAGVTAHAWSDDAAGDASDPDGVPGARRRSPAAPDELAAGTPTRARATYAEPLPTQPFDTLGDIDDDLPRGRSHAPYTLTDGSYAPGDAPAPAAAARAAFTPTRATSAASAPQSDPAPQPAPAPHYDSALQPDPAPAVADGDEVRGSGIEQTPEPPVRSVPPAPSRAADPWAPPGDDAPGAEGFDTSGEVSAIVGAPAAGSPRSARASVSAQHNVRELPDSEEAFDETIIASRRRTDWMLTPPLGAPIAITADVLILGRRPTFDPRHPDAQLVPIADDTRTVSKTHARLERQGEGWTIVDLDSTNGVILLGQNGTEVDAAPGRPERLTEQFLLGDAHLSVAPTGP